MSRSASIPTGPATLAHLRRDHRLLEIHCACSRVVWIDTTQVEEWPDELAVPEVRRLLRCSKCGVRPVQTKPDTRVHGVDGTYPKF